MRKVNISTAIVISILIGVISLCLLLINGYKMVAYRPYAPWNLSELSEKDMKHGRYVHGDILDCFKISYTNSLGATTYMGNDGGLFDGAHFFYSYTIPIATDRYIRIWLLERSDSQKGMEELINGKTNIVPFTGQIKKGSDINSEFYNHDPDFDQGRIIAEYSLWEKGTDSERNLCILGLLGLVISWLLYRSAGGIEVREVMDTTAKPQYNYDRENELDIANKLLEKYYAEEKSWESF